MPDHAIADYCWGHPHDGGKLVRVGFKRAADIIRELRGSTYAAAAGRSGTGSSAPPTP